MSKSRWRKRWISFQELGQLSQESKAKVWAACNGTPLGHVRWFTRWGCYVFYPECDTFFSDDSLRAIADFCGAQNMAYKKAK